MAKVLIEGDTVDIRVSLLERVMLAERSRKLPLAHIRRVDPHPPLLDMMLHWSDQSGVWLCGVSAYDGHMIPSARHPSNTLALEIASDEQQHVPPERIYIEVDDESPTELAARIARAQSTSTQSGLGTRAEPPRAFTEQQERAVHSTSQVNTEVPMPTPTQPSSTPSRRALMEALDVELDDDVQLRDPLMQGSLPPPPTRMSEPAPEMKLDDDKDLTRMGGWLVGLGTLGLLTGGVMLAGGALPGLLAVGAGVTCALLGGVALAVVAHHQG
jgi:hypothetical protein